MKALIIASVVASSLSACSSITAMDGSEVDASRAPASCDVRVYQTYQAAIKQGPIEELCVINGSASMSFDKSVSGTINRHKTKACACGAQDVYIQSRSGGDGFSDVTVSMVAFRRP